MCHQWWFTRRLSSLCISDVFCNRNSITHACDHLFGYLSSSPWVHSNGVYVHMCSNVMDHVSPSSTHAQNALWIQNSPLYTSLHRFVWDLCRKFLCIVYESCASESVPCKCESECRSEGPGLVCCSATRGRRSPPFGRGEARIKHVCAQCVHVQVETRGTIG